MKNAQINAICSQFSVSLTAISKYNSEHKNEIDNITDIFYLKGDSKKKILALLYILSSGKDDDAVKRYRKETGLNNDEYDSASLIEQYKVLLLTAMVYNRAFYSMAVNYRGFVNSGLAIGEIEEGSINMAQKTNVNNVSLFNRRKFPERRNIRGISHKVIFAVTAAAAGFVIVFFFAVLFKFFNFGLGRQINNEWTASLIEPKKTLDGIAYVPMEQGVRMELMLPSGARARGAKIETDSTKATIDYYTKEMRADKNNADLYISRGIAYTLNGYLEAAVKDFNKAIELDPKNSSAYYNRALANAGMDKGIDTIVADLETVLSLNPGDKDAYCALGVVYFNQYQKEDDSMYLDFAKDAFESIKDKDKDKDKEEDYRDIDRFLRYMNSQ